MSTITLTGNFYHRGIGNDPIVFIDREDEQRLNIWHAENNIFTQIMIHPDPATGASLSTIYVTENLTHGLEKGCRVSISIEIRPEKRGHGIKTLTVLPL